MKVRPDGKDTSFIFSQLSKAPSFMEIRLGGRIKSVKLVQKEKAHTPIEVTLDGSATFVKPMQSLYLQIALYQQFTI